MSAEAQNAPAPSQGAGAYASLMVMSFIAGSVFLFNELALEGYSPAEMSCAKLLIGGVTLFLPIWATGGLIPMTGNHWSWVLALGLIGYALPQFSMAWAQQRVDTTAAALFIAALPLFTLFLVRVVLKERYRWKKWAGFFLGFLGLVIMINPRAALSADGVGVLPYLALCVTCLCFAVSGLMVQRMPFMPALQVASLSLLVGGIALAPLGLVGFVTSTKGLFSQSNTSWETFQPLFGVVMLGTGLSGLGQAMRTGLIQKHGTAFFSIVGYIVPVWAAVLGVVFLGEEITLRKVAAFCVISMGLLLAQGVARPTRRGARGIGEGP